MESRDESFTDTPVSDATPAPALAEPFASALSRWESSTIETLGPLLSTHANDALTGAIHNLRTVIATAAAAAS